MKRKTILSCLTILFAVLFSNFAMAQIPGATARAAQTPPVTVYKTLFICNDQVRPVELGWDVLQMSSVGDWKAIYPVGAAFPADTYDGKNVFKVLGTTPGTYVFSHTATGNYCGVTTGQQIWAYVVVVPPMSGVNADITACDIPANRTAITTSVSTSAGIVGLLPTSFTNVLNQAGAATGFTPTYSAAPVWTLNPATTDTTFTTTVTIGGMPANYTCATTFNFDYSVTFVNQIGVIPGRSITICPAQIDATAQSPYSYFTVSTIPAANNPLWNPSEVSLANLGNGATGTYNFELTYTDCDGTPRTSTFTVVVTANPTLDIANEQVYEFCKPQHTTLDLTWAYNTVVVSPGASLPLTGVSWTSMGTDKTKTPGTYVFPALGNPYQADKYSQVAKMLANTKYYFRAYVDISGPCGLGGQFDTLTVIAKSANDFKHGRIQVCRALAPSINMANILGLTDPATWTAVTPAPTPAVNATTGVVSIATSTELSLYKYKYVVASAPGTCGAGDGVFYVKVVDQVILPANTIEVSICVEALPEYISLNDIAGVAGVWTSTEGLVAPKFDSATGLINSAELAPVDGQSYNFTLPAASVCNGGQPVNVKINFTGTI